MGRKIRMCLGTFIRPMAFRWENGFCPGGTRQFGHFMKVIRSAGVRNLDLLGEFLRASSIDQIDLEGIVKRWKQNTGWKPMPEGPCPKGVGGLSPGFQPWEPPSMAIRPEGAADRKY
jgi:hypothetical protein